MGQYVYGIIGAAAVIGVMESILPKSGRTRQYVRLITALCLLCLVVKPIGSFLESLPALLEDGMAGITEGVGVRDEYETILSGQIEAVVRDELCAAVREELSARFSIESCEAGATLTRTDGVLSVSRVVITLFGKDVFKNPYAIEEYFSDLLGCECIVTVG